MQASSETAAITAKAMENADAVILVYDRLPITESDIELIEKLKQEGKADKLFVVQNKMDNNIDPEQKKSFIEERIAKFSQMGIRARVFPLSCKDLEACDNGFEKFREALALYLKNDLQNARDSSLARRIKIVSEYLSAQCEEAIKINSLRDVEQRKTLKIDAETRIRTIQQKTEETLRGKKRDINLLRNNVIDRWISFSGRLKDEVSSKIKNATKEQLNRANTLFADIQIMISNFLRDEFVNAEYEIRKDITRTLDNIQLPAAKEEARNINVPARWDKNIKIPPEFGTLGLLAYTFFAKVTGFWSLLFCIPNLFLIYVFSPFINKIFQQLLNMGIDIGDAMFKSKLQKAIEERWHEIDETARKKIDEFFAALQEQMERGIKESVYEATGEDRGKIRMADSIKENKTDEFKNYKRQLEAISGQ